MKTIQTEWDSCSRVLTTSFQGDVTQNDVSLWKQSLWEKLSIIPAGTHFKLLLDLRGFFPVDIETHKSMRNIIPEVLARHGLRPAFIDLFEEKPEMTITICNQNKCVAFANVHHDENKMADYRKRIGSDNQQFFTDLEAARRWISAL